MTQTEIYHRCIRELGASRTLPQLVTAKRYYELFLKTKPEKVMCYELYLDTMFRANKNRLQ